MTDLDEAYRLSKNLALASLMPDALRGKPSDVLAMMLYGQDLGLSPMQAIQGIYVVKGKPQLSGTTWIALARKAGHRVRIIESNDVHGGDRPLGRPGRAAPGDVHAGRRRQGGAVPHQGRQGVPEGQAR
jgi:hypothetical protein